MSNFNAEDIARYREQHRNEVFQVEEIETISFDENGHENGTWNGFAVSKIDDPVNYCYECRDKMNADKLSEYLNSISFLDEPVIDNLSEWSRLITELCDREKDLYKVKEEYNALSEKIIAETDFKALYGKNNESIRKQHVKSELSDMYGIIKAHEFGIDYCKRRISFLKQLIHTKTILLEVKK